LRHPADSQAWRTIDEKFPEIAKDPRNLWLGKLADGVDVNSGTRHNSVWPVLFVIYNLPPWLCMNARLDLAELGIKPELFARQEEDKTTLPPAGYTLTNAEKDIFCETLSNIRVPQGYCSNFSSLVSLKDRKLIGLKSHDYHMLMQEKEISLQELDKLQLELVVTLCLLEKFFPPSFFDIMIHLTMHLTMEVERELAISKDSVSETIRWISYGPRATIVKYEAYNINGYIFHMKSNDGIVYQNSRVSVEAVDLHISKEVATTIKLGEEESLEVEMMLNNLNDVMIIGPCNDDIRRWAAKKQVLASILLPSTQGLLDAYGYNTIEEYLSWNYFPSTDNESTDMETTDKRNTDKDCIVDSNSAMSKDEIEKKIGARKSKTCADKAKGKRKVSCGS
ncbi:helitron helicase-like domain-containing protein, partial [Tanacetum coccineum]